MAVYERKVMCGECPFRAKAPPGWLGPWKIDDIESMLDSVEGLICHVDVARLNSQARKLGIQPDLAADGQHCVGMLRYMNAHCKGSRDPEKFAAQQAIKQVPDVPVIPAREFRKHHESSFAEAMEKGKAVKCTQCGTAQARRKDPRFANPENDVCVGCHKAICEELAEEAENDAELYRAVLPKEPHAVTVLREEREIRQAMVTLLGADLARIDAEIRKALSKPKKRKPRKKP